MTEHERAFLERLREKYGSEPFAPGTAIEDFRLSELPDAVRVRLILFGCGIGLTKAFCAWLAQRAGAVRLDRRTREGYLWRLP